MKVSIDISLFTEHNFMLVESILPYFYEERHIWYIENEDEIFNSSWFLENTPKKQKIIRENIEKCISHYENERQYYKSAPFFDIDLNNVEKARIILSSPLHIIVENIQSDKLFIEAIVDKFAQINNPYAKRIQKAIKPEHNWARFSHGGGSDWVKVAHDLIETYTKYRVFVFSDSDKLYPTDNSQKKENIEKECRILAIPFHVLYKREIENYLPDKALESFANDIGKIAVYNEFKNLSASEKDFYDIEKGFQGGNEREFYLKQKENGLFTSLLENQVSRIEIGFGNKSKIVSYFRKKDANGKYLISAHDLIEHCKHHPILAHQNPRGEMIDIIIKIANTL